MQSFNSPFGRVELTDERLRHVLEFHPEVRPHLKQIAKALATPRVVRRSKFDPNVHMCYHPLSQRKYLAVVIKTNQRNFILTIYLTTKTKHQKP